MSIKKIRNLIDNPEGPHLEFKKVVPPPASIARCIASFSNTDGGVIIIGINDDGSILGLEDDVLAPEMVEASIRRIKPKPIVSHYFVNIKEDFEEKKLYVIEIKKSHTPVFTENNTIFKRTGSCITKVLPHEIVNIFETLQFEASGLPEIIDEINNSKQNVTDSKVKFLKQYTDLLVISKNSFRDLCSGKSHGRTLMRLILSSLIDTFESYLATLLLEIHLSQPATLKTKASVTVEDVLNCQSMSEFIRFVANNQIKKLKKGSEEGFDNSFKKATNFDIFLDSEKTQIKKYFQIRHLYTHNNGQVDEQFLSKYPITELQIGDEHKISIKDFCKAINFFINIVNRIDINSISKYNLTTYECKF